MDIIHPSDSYFIRIVRDVCCVVDGGEFGDRLIVVKIKGDIQLSHDCKSAKTIIANNADYTPASSYALAA